MAESGFPGFDMGAWWGLVGQAKVPEDVIRKATAAVQDILSSPAYAAAIAPQGVTPGKQVGEAFAKRIADDAVKFVDVVKRAGIQPE